MKNTPIRTAGSERACRRGVIDYMLELSRYKSNILIYKKAPCHRFHGDIPQSTRLQEDV